MVVCSGCSCLCDDIEIVIKGSEIKEVRNACRIGADLFFDYNLNRATCALNGEKLPMEKALDAAISILKDAKRPFVFGLDCSTIGAQKRSIALAKKIGATIDDASSYCQGAVTCKILSSEIKTCTLDDVRNRADVIIYWGSDPSNSHPRHMSRFSYFPRGEFRLKGWEIERSAICIDVRESSTEKVCRRKIIIPPGNDGALIEELIEALEGRVPSSSSGIEAKKAIELAGLFKKAEYGVIFTGMGLINAIKNDLTLLEDFMNKLNEFTEFHLMPMLRPTNTRGFNQILYEETGFVNRVKFNSKDNDGVEYGDEHSFIETLKRGDLDAALVVGSDPLSTIPFSISKKLADIPTITISSTNTPTTMISQVVLTSAKTAVEVDGSLLRMDGIECSIEKAMDSEYLSEEEILKRLLEGV
ncbi:MAG: formylmethanofuran dehydrogenase subunit B [Halobacteriota archaeon]|nr:formylmethanofuran dehydrogenase subunit B [Halobacteriota archaeon]